MSCVAASKRGHDATPTRLVAAGNCKYCVHAQASFNMHTCVCVCVCVCHCDMQAPITGAVFLTFFDIAVMCGIVRHMRPIAYTHAYAYILSRAYSSMCTYMRIYVHMLGTFSVQSYSHAHSYFPLQNPFKTDFSSCMFAGLCRSYFFT